MSNSEGLKAAEQLLYIAEHIAHHELPHEDSPHRSHDFRWKDKTDDGLLISADFNLAGSAYPGYEGTEALLVPSATFGVYEPDGSGTEITLSRNLKGKPKRFSKSKIFTEMILKEFVYFPYYQEADLLFEGLQKIRSVH